MGKIKIEYRKIIENINKNFEEMIKQDEGISGFILNVADTLNEVGAYRIEMVIEDGDNKIALECDGERWYTQENLPNDLTSSNFREA